ncbi:MAG: sulfate adenylyltransferase [Nitrospinales bacterium]
MSKEILCTLGPASLKKTVLQRMNDLPVTLFRINLSHTSLDDLSENIRLIQSISDKPLCIDTEGPQIRTGKVAEGRVLLQEGSFLTIHRESVPGNAQEVAFYPAVAIDQIQRFDFISIDTHGVMVQVVEKKDGRLRAKVITEGFIGSNKAVTVANRSVILNSLTQKDEKAIQIAGHFGIRHFALSFASRREDVLELRRLTGKNSTLIAKIENRSGVDHVESIARESDAILIDRGDLSREEPIEAIPLLQKHIIQAAKKVGTKVYVATNLLESMVTQAKPTRAEVNDVFNTLIDGADGLVLAAETAIGSNPVGCVNMISKLIHQYDNYSKFGIQTIKYDKRSLLIEPHGGSLINRFLENPDIDEIGRLPCLTVDEKIVLDCEQIAFGVYSPLQGFMNREEVENVLDHYHLPSGDVWTLPIVFQIPKERAAKLKPGDTVALFNETLNERFALLHLEEIFSLDLDSLAKRMFGTDSSDHPGVDQVKNAGNTFLGGKIDLIKVPEKPSQTTPYILRPADTRMIFEQKNWFRIVGFHTRNVIHRGHEFIQMKALNDHYCDGLFISPVIGPKKKNDFQSEVVLHAYQTMVDCNLYPKNKVLIGAFLTYPRYAGPREAVFTALCRKNFGCSHFIIGRDHAGVKDFYHATASARFFDDLGDIGIEPVFFDEVVYCRQCKTHRLSCNHSETDVQRISGSQVRQTFCEGKSFPSWLLREEISEILSKARKTGKQIFVT